MESRHVVLLGAVALVGAAAIALRRRPAGTTGRGPSSRRTRVLELLREVVPSEYGSPKFARIAPGFSPAILERYPTYTTCGELPAFVGRNLGFKGKIVQAGLELLRTESKERGCWRTLTDGRPKPGDFYGLSNDPNGIIVHVGIITAADGVAWTTADAGQGPREMQRAEFVQRTFNPDSGTLTAGGRTKFLAGWVDIDCYAAASAAA